VGINMGSAEAAAASLPLAGWGPAGLKLGRQVDSLATSSGIVHLGPHLDRSHVSVSVPPAMIGTVCKKQRDAHC
jgi:hypothetical protein